MRRNSGNLQKYKKTCQKVWERANGVCEVLINGKRCNKFIPLEQCTYTSFAHTETRNGKSDEWVCDPENIIYTCESHHLEEHRTGKKLIRCDYDEITYVPEN